MQYAIASDASIPSVPILGKQTSESEAISRMPMPPKLMRSVSDGHRPDINFRNGENKLSEGRLRPTPTLEGEGSLWRASLALPLWEGSTTASRTSDWNVVIANETSSMELGLTVHIGRGTEEFEKAFVTLRVEVDRGARTTPNKGIAFCTILSIVSTAAEIYRSLISVLCSEIDIVAATRTHGFLLDVVCTLDVVQALTLDSAYEELCRFAAIYRRGKAPRQANSVGLVLLTLLGQVVDMLKPSKDRSSSVGGSAALKRNRLLCGVAASPLWDALESIDPACVQLKSQPFSVHRLQHMALRQLFDADVLGLIPSFRATGARLLKTFFPSTLSSADGVYFSSSYDWELPNMIKNNIAKFRTLQESYAGLNDSVGSERVAICKYFMDQIKTRALDEVLESVRELLAILGSLCDAWLELMGPFVESSTLSSLKDITRGHTSVSFSFGHLCEQFGLLLQVFYVYAVGVLKHFTNRNYRILN